MIHVCVPVLKRYDLLRNLLISLRESTVTPVLLSIINNGHDRMRLSMALLETTIPTQIHTPMTPMGVAESWNWFLQNVPDDRVIMNDDVTVAPDSLEKLVDNDADLAWAAGCGFSCFLLRDSCIEKIGYFDEAISPGYAYYEDEDYLQRLDGRGTREPSAKTITVDCGVVHLRSQTLAAATSLQEVNEHHRKFLIAQGNYAKKWGVVF